MKKNIIKIAVCIALVIAGTTVFAGEGRGCGPGHECRPCPGAGHHHHHGGNDGVRLAADIVGLVGASVNCLRTVTTPVVYTQPTVVTQPVIYAQPIVPCAPMPPPPPHHHCR